MGSRIAVMNEGVLQQVGAPQALYDTPMNRFVAGFIGSPSMNFVDVTLDGSGGAPGSSGPATGRSRCRAVHARRVEPGGQSLVAGFRPEHLDIGDAHQRVGSFRARADVVEYLGNEELLHLNAADKDIVAIVDSEHRVRPGDIVSLVLPLTRSTVRRRDRHDGRPRPRPARTRPRRSSSRGRRPTRRSRRRRRRRRSELTPTRPRTRRRGRPRRAGRRLAGSSTTAGT